MYRAIIVDDEPFMREGMRRMIDYARFGFALVGEAADARQALALLDAQRPHLMITDVMMPGVQGTELALLAAQQYPDTLLVFISGYRNFSFAQAAIRARALGYLVKPIDPDAVHDILALARDTLDGRYAPSHTAAIGAPDNASAAPEPPDRVARALAYVEAHYARDLSVREIAQSLHLNPAYLGQLVRKRTGRTLRGHLLRMRVEKACLLLTTTLMPVGEIAAAVGIDDTGYFSQLFRRQTGLRPREYRRQRGAQPGRDACD